MKFTPDPPSSNFIHSYIPGEFHLRNTKITTNIIISHDQLITDWSPPAVDQLSMTDFDPALALKPDLILFGTGPEQQFPHIALLAAIMRSGVAIEVMETSAACRTFNVLVAEDRAVVAALLVN